MFRFIFCVFLSLFFMSLQTAYAENRVALVIGNSAYQHTEKLTNPVNDARLMARTLRALNFEVIERTNLTQTGMKRAISTFARTVQKRGEDTIGLVFYAGHGVQVRGLNYLIPVDAEIKSEADLELWTVAADRLLSSMTHIGNRLNIIIFDACRNNPFRGLFRNSKQGLAQMQAPRGSLISFATAPGDVALDGDRENSPFTLALAKHLSTPGITLERVLKRTGKDVLRATSKSQRPWWNRDIYDDLYLAGRPKKSQPPITKKKAGTKVAVGVYPGKEPSKRSRFVHGYKFDDCNGADWCPKMIVVRGDTFTMGSEESEKGRGSDEGPRRNVTIKKFAVGRFEVTVGEYLSCVKSGQCRAPEWRERGSKYNIRTGSNKYYKKLMPSLTAANSPIVGISWDDAQSYVKWLSERTGQRYRLLTEAEWEYSALGGATTRYWMGNSISRSQANYGVAEKLTPINSFNPNPFGLYNVHGNVWEWGEDCWHGDYGDYKGAPTDGSAWLKAKGGDCNVRVLRGGSWSNVPQALRARNRSRLNRDVRVTNVGFRVARAL